MSQIANLVAEWECFDQAAFQAESRLERVLDDYCEAGGPVPGAAQIWQCKRLRFVANHRLRWLLFQVRKAQASLPLI